MTPGACARIYSTRSVSVQLYRCVVCVMSAVNYASAGEAPVFITDGLGADVMRRIALPMVGGMVSTLVLTLLVVPAIYFLWEAFRLRLDRDASEVSNSLSTRTEA